MRVDSHSQEQTQKLGETFGRSLQPGDIVLLFGDLGAGKTTFTQGVASGLGFPDYIRSPTFTLINEYAGKWPIYHIDLYRLDSLNDIRALNIDDYLYGDGVVLVEWAEKLFEGERPGFGIEARYEVKIGGNGKNHRTIDITPVKIDGPAFRDFPLQ